MNFDGRKSRGNGRDDRIRTCDVLVPNQVLYQAELRPERGDPADNRGIRKGFLQRAWESVAILFARPDGTHAFFVRPKLPDGRAAIRRRKSVNHPG